MAEAARREFAKRQMDLPPSLRRKIAELSELGEDWDGEGARGVRPWALAEVVKVLLRLLQRRPDFREPFVAPGSDGFVQIEWHQARRSLEIEAVSKGWELVGTVNVAGGHRQYFTAECGRGNLDQLERFYDWFLGRELIWPSQ